MCSKTHFTGFFFSLLIFSFSTQYATSVTAPADEVSVMFSLSKSLDAGKTLGWTDSNPCNWKGVTCSNNGVTVIKISGVILTGKQLPADLGKLQNLNQLEVINCYLGGPLPTLAGMSNLQTLFLQNNSFSSIPDDFFKGLSSLQIVSLDDNKNLASWQIPATLRDSSSLTNFSAISANVIGTIPNLFDAFPSLEHLALSYNNLEGELPASFASSPMNTLWLNNQEGKQLSGPITVLQNMTSLVQVWLHVNSFSGPLPDFSGLTSLVELQIRDNQFTGPVPGSLIRLTNVKTVGLKNNRLQGPLPKFPASVQNDVTLPLNRFCLPDPGVACDPRVNALLLVLKPLNYPFRLADSWQGNNPCNSWTGISCDGGGNISVINFQNMGLVGTISPNFALFTSLKKLILAVNNITGSIPVELTGLVLLNELDVHNNDLSGPIPKFKNTQLKTSGNPNLGGAIGVPPPDRSAGGPSPSGSGGSNSSNGSNGKNNGVVVGSVIGVICFILLVSGVFFYCYCKKRNRAFNRVQNPNTMLIHPRISGSDPDMIKITVAGSSINGGTVSDNLSQGSNGSSNIQVVEAGNMVISIQVLRTITDNFSDENILGRGGFGTVYKGELHDGTKVAVKRMESGMINAKGLDEFKSEIAVLTKVRHRHLVSLLWYCLDGNERLLVYEYMPQGTLSQHLFGWNEEGIRPLDWMKRLIIALDVARGVEYLHTLAHQSFIHRDLKPSNILLGDDLRAKVSDFGLVRLAPDGKDGKCMSVVTRLAGTFGYLAPEYAGKGEELTALQKHVAFFDINGDGIVYPWETYKGFRSIGCGRALSTISAFFINTALSDKTTQRKLPSPLFPIYIRNIHKAKHGSDSGVYDMEGRFVPSKFEEIFEKHALSFPAALTSKELDAMLKANRVPKDRSGWVASWTEWKILYLLCKDKDGLLPKETIRAVYDGSLFEEMKKKKIASDKKKK